MDDFVGRVVEQVLGGAKPGAAAMPARPNYQREKAKSRISVQEYPPAGPASRAAEPPETDRFQPCSDGYAAVRRAALSNAAPAINPPGSARPSADASAPLPASPLPVAAKLIAEADRRVCEMLGLRFAVGGSVGVVSGRETKFSYLLAADEVLRSFSALDYAIDWGHATTGFLFRFSGAGETVSQALREYEQALRTKFRPGGVFTVPQPSPFVQRYLKIGGRFPAAILEDIDLAQAACRINAFYQARKDSTVQFRAWGGAVIATGELEEITAALEDFRTNARGGE